MPEGDSILRLARRLRPAIGAGPLRVTAPHPRGRLAGVERLDGRRLVAVDTHGKHLLLRFEGELVLHSHIAMTGRWLLMERDRASARALRAAWAVFEGGPLVAAQYRGPTLRVLTDAQARGDLRLRSLGPDVLAAGFSPTAALGRIRRGAGWRPIAGVLLDQRVLAGPGLIYASEAPAAARVHPLQPVGSLTDEELLQVIVATRELMLDAAATGRQPKTVQSRKGQPCLRCATPVAGSVVGDHARRVYWCPACQPARRPDLP